MSRLVRSPFHQGVYLSRLDDLFLLGLHPAVSTAGAGGLRFAAMPRDSAKFTHRTVRRRIRVGVGTEDAISIQRVVATVEGASGHQTPRM